MPYMPVVVDFVWPRSIPNCSSRYPARRKASANVRNQQLHNFPLPSVLSVGESGFCSLIQREIHPSHHVRSINSLWSNHSAKLPSAERYLLIVFCAIAGLPSEAFASINFRNDRLSNALMSAALEGHSTSLCFQSRTALRLTLETSEVSPMNSAKSFTNFRLRSQVSVDPPIRWATDQAAIAFSSPSKRYTLPSRGVRPTVSPTSCLSSPRIRAVNIPISGTST